MTGNGGKVRGHLVAGVRITGNFNIGPEQTRLLSLLNQNTFLSFTDYVGLLQTATEHEENHASSSLTTKDSFSLKNTDHSECQVV